MTIESVNTIVRDLPENVHVHPLTRFANGDVKLIGKGARVRITLEFSIEQLGSPFSDIRALLNPWDNKMVPLIMFVEPNVARAAGGDHG